MPRRTRRQPQHHIQRYARLPLRLVRRLAGGARQATLKPFLIKLSTLSVEFLQVRGQMIDDMLFDSFLESLLGLALEFVQRHEDQIILG